MYLKSGTKLHMGRYKIVEVIGEGGIGIIYRAEDSIGRIVAIKEFFPRKVVRRDGKFMFSREKTLKAQMELQRSIVRFVKQSRCVKIYLNPYRFIPTIYDTFRENGTAYQVMEFVEGLNLFDFVRFRGTLSEDEAISIGLKLARYLRVMHKYSIYHLDIKPHNVLLLSRDINVNRLRIKILDFDNLHCRWLDRLKFNIHFTPGFSAPDILHWFDLEREHGSKVEGWRPGSDVYSLSATMYYLLTGLVPEGDIITDIGDLRSDLSPSVAEVIMSGLRHSYMSRPALNHVIKVFKNLLTNRGVKRYAG